MTTTDKGQRRPRHIIKVSSSSEIASNPTVSSLPMATLTSRDNTSPAAADEEESSLPLDVVSEGNEKCAESDSRTPRISRLTSLELQVLRYFYDNPGDRAHHAASIFGIEIWQVSGALQYSLKNLLHQNHLHGWQLTDSARLELDVFDQQG